MATPLSRFGSASIARSSATLPATAGPWLHTTAIAAAPTAAADATLVQDSRRRRCRNRVPGRTYRTYSGRLPE